MNGEIALRPQNSFSGNICFKFSVLVLCSVLKKTLALHAHLWTQCITINNCELQEEKTGFESVSYFRLISDTAFIVMHVCDRTLSVFCCSLLSILRRLLRQYIYYAHTVCIYFSLPLFENRQLTIHAFSSLFL